MKKNVVFIETISSTGSGILYPCNYNLKNKKNNMNYYIIFTNMHVLNDIQSKSNPNENVKGLVFVHIYDDFGKLIKENDIVSIISFCPDIQKINKSEDISAMLVAIKDTRLITLETNISSDSLTNREVIFLEGYPGIMLDDDISPKIQLQGLNKSGFPESGKMGVFQVSDDYHWYNNLYDLYLFKGMSGGPVYRDQEGKTSLLGMIQSVSALEEGQNPFKLVYYLRMEFILEFLRSSGCIIFKKISETEYLIDCIYGLKEGISKYENAPTFLLIGGSGAGKSSFAKDFAYHGSNLLTTNDGQTTRTTVAYEYSIFCDEPNAHVEFMNQEEFCKRISLLQGADPILSLIQELYMFSENLVKNEGDFLENFYCFLEELKTRKKNSAKTIDLIEAYLDSKRKGIEFEAKVAFEIYERLLVILIRYIPSSLAKLLFDVKWIESLKKQYEDSYEKQYGSKEEKNFFLNKIMEKETRNIEKEVGSEWRLIIDKYFNEELYWREYRNKMIKFILNDDRYSKKEHQRKLKTMELLDNFKSEYIKKLLHIDGFFDIQEFFFLDSIKELELLESLDNPFPKTESNKNAIEGREGFEIDFWKGTQDIYKNVYQKIKKSVCEEYSISPTNFRRTFNLTLLDDRSKKELQLCLQVVSGKSLTGLIRNVKIKDMISNEHAMTLYELKIAKIKMYDTYGLDHVEGMKSIENTLYSYIYQMNEYEKIRYKDINILYFKKLDAGRPDELKVMLPCVRKVIPQAPVYCIFTGIDIFYKNYEEVKNLQWKRNNEKAPKSVRYILSDRADFTLNDGEYNGNKKNRSMYLVLRNNLVPYCGDKKKVQNEYYYMKNNEIYIKRMLASIVMKEYSSIEIVDLEEFENLSEDKKKKIDDFIIEIFKRASVNVDGVHWNTIRANISRMGNDNKLGAWTSFRYQWNQRFHEAFTYAVGKFGTELARQFCDSEDAIESALKNVEDSFLGTAENLSKINLQNEEKNNFRIYMEEMYKSGYIYNPYMTDESEFELILKNSELRKSYFLDVFNFAKGLKSNESLLRKFTNEFIGKLHEELQNDNKIKVKNIIHLNPSFADSVEAIKTEFIEKYKLDKDYEGKVEKDFKRILQAYIANL